MFMNEKLLWIPKDRWLTLVTGVFKESTALRLDEEGNMIKMLNELDIKLPFSVLYSFKIPMKLN